MEERIQQRLEEIIEQRDAIRLSGNSFLPGTTERKRLAKKFTLLDEAVKYLEKGPSEQFIKDEIEKAFKKIEVRSLERQRVDAEFANEYISKDVYDEKIASLSDKNFKKQIKFLRSILPKN
jgi:Fe-S cluster assembly scaffold protein SufB